MTEEEYNKALKIIEMLMDLEPLTDFQKIELKRLVEKVYDYEEEHYPMPY